MKRRITKKNSGEEEPPASEEEFDDTKNWDQYKTVETNQVKKSDFWTRFWSAIILAVSFIIICWNGIRPTVLLVNALQFALFKELLDVRYRSAVEKEIPWFRTLHWGWFISAMFYTYAPQVISLFIPTLPQLEVVLKYHSLIGIILYSFNFVLFVLCLKKGCLKYQISQLAWTLLNIVLVVLQTSSMITNMSEGMIWFFFPVFLVCINDTTAYLFGRTFGRKFIKQSLTPLSPKKSWEGFIGGFICTVIIAFYSPYIWKLIPRWYCPYDNYTCDLPAFLIPTEYALPEIIQTITGKASVTLLPLQLHGLCLGFFASLVSPFGGLFASAIKRAYGKKDFNNIIPGHGGLMDRLDCQLIMIMFTGVYYNTFVKTTAVDLVQVSETISHLSTHDQEILLAMLTNILENKH
ncbi:hypothetical protein WA158_004101 [Blastocystis sp. Blastoise]